MSAPGKQEPRSDVVSTDGPFRNHGDPEVGGHTTNGGRVFGVTSWTYTDCERYGCPVVAVIDVRDRSTVERFVKLLPPEWNLGGFVEHEPDTWKQSCDEVQNALGAIAYDKAASPHREGLWLQVDPEGIGEHVLWEGERVVANRADVPERVWELLMAQLTAQNDEEALR